MLRTIRAFESGLHIDRQKLILPSNLKVELGLVNISYEPIVVAERVYRERCYRKRVNESEVTLLNPVERTTNTINLEEFYSQPSLVHVDAENRVMV